MMALLGRQRSEYARDGLLSPAERKSFGSEFLAQPPGKEAMASDFEGFDLRPLNPGEQIRNPDGSHSTEYVVTIQGPDGQWMNVPSLWMTPDGVRRFSDEGDVWKLANIFEKKNGVRFPRFSTPQDGGESAAERSMNGGLANGPLYRRSE